MTQNTMRPSFHDSTGTGPADELDIDAETLANLHVSWESGSWHLGACQ